MLVQTSSSDSGVFSDIADMLLELDGKDLAQVSSLIEGMATPATDEEALAETVSTEDDTLDGVATFLA